MPKRKTQGHPQAADPNLSLRWPNLFSSAEQVEALLHFPPWAVLLADLVGKVEEFSHDITHGLPKNDVDTAEQNFMRGKISAFEDLIGLAEEYKEWKESKK